jgi:hypothetical protein
MVARRLLLLWNLKFNCQSIFGHESLMNLFSALAFNPSMLVGERKGEKVNKIWVEGRRGFI